MGSAPLTMCWMGTHSRTRERAGVSARGWGERHLGTYERMDVSRVFPGPYLGDWVWCVSCVSDCTAESCQTDAVNTTVLHLTAMARRSTDTPAWAIAMPTAL